MLAKSSIRACRLFHHAANKSANIFRQKQQTQLAICCSSIRTFTGTQTTQIKDLNFECVNLTRPSEFVVHLELNRPKKYNSLSPTLWAEIEKCFQALDGDEDCRAIVLTGAGRGFCAGLDFESMQSFGSIAMSDADVARKFKSMVNVIKGAQSPFTAIEKCQKPVIGFAHGACVGAGLGMYTACDVRYGAQDSYFSIKEVDIGISADVGTLQRMPKQTGGDSSLRELAYTARNFYIDEAKQIGMVSRVFSSYQEGLAAALSLAKLISSKSPVAVQGSKINLNYARDHSVDESLHYHATYNACNLQSEDTVKAAMAAATKQKEPPVFDKL